MCQYGQRFLRYGFQISRKWRFGIITRPFPRLSTLNPLKRRGGIVRCAHPSTGDARHSRCLCGARFRSPNPLAGSYPAYRAQKNPLSGIFGAPGGIRTHDPRLRRPILYPTELRALNYFATIPHPVRKTNKKFLFPRFSLTLKRFAYKRTYLFSYC